MNLPDRITEINDLVARIDAMSDAEFADFYTKFEAVGKAWNEWRGPVKDAMIERVETHGEPLIETAEGPKRLYVTVDKVTKCNSPAETLAGMLDNTGGDLDAVARCLSSGAWKPGACRGVLGGEWRRHFTVEERKSLKEGSARKVLRLARNAKEASDGEDCGT